MKTMRQISRLFGMFLALLGATLAQQQVSLSQQQPIHAKFLDRANIERLSFAATAMTIDALTTQRFLSADVQNRYRVPPHELNPIARPFVTRGAGGQALATGTSFAVTIAAAYVLHRLHHHRLERATPIVAGAVSLVAGVQNLRF